MPKWNSGLKTSHWLVTFASYVFKCWILPASSLKCCPGSVHNVVFFSQTKSTFLCNWVEGACLLDKVNLKVVVRIFQVPGMETKLCLVSASYISHVAFVLDASFIKVVATGPLEQCKCISFVIPQTVWIVIDLWTDWLTNFNTIQMTSLTNIHSNI